MRITIALDDDSESISFSINGNAEGIASVIMGYVDSMSKREAEQKILLLSSSHFDGGITDFEFNSFGEEIKHSDIPDWRGKGKRKMKRAR